MTRAYTPLFMGETQNEPEPAMSLETRTDLFLQRWVPSVSRESATVELAALIAAVRKECE